MPNGAYTRTVSTITSTFAEIAILDAHSMRSASGVVSRRRPHWQRAFVAPP